MPTSNVGWALAQQLCEAPHLRAIDRSCLVQKLGVLEKEAQINILNILAILFQK